MKKKKLLKLLKEKGATFYKQGACHEIWESDAGKRFTVPRHSEIGERLAETILKQAD